MNPHLSSKPPEAQNLSAALASDGSDACAPLSATKAEVAIAAITNAPRSLKELAREALTNAPRSEARAVKPRLCAKLATQPKTHSEARFEEITEAITETSAAGQAAEPAASSPRELRDMLVNKALRRGGVRKMFDRVMGKEITILRDDLCFFARR